MFGNKCCTFCKHILYIYSINGFVVLVTNSDTYFVPRAPETFLLRHPMASIGASIMPIGLTTIPHGQAHNVVAFLRLEFAIRSCGAPASKEPHKFLPIEVRGRGEGVHKKWLCRWCPDIIRGVQLAGLPALPSGRTHSIGNQGMHGRYVDGWACWVDLLF